MAQGFTSDYIVKATGDSNQWVDLIPANTDALTSEDVEFAIPAGVKQFKLMFHYVTNPTAANDIKVTLGTAGGYVITGYAASSSRLGSTSIATTSSTTAFLINRAATSDDISGVLEFVLLDEATNMWSMSGTLADRNTTLTWIEAGAVTLTDGLTSVKIDSTADWGSTAGSKIGCTYLNPELAVSGIESVAAGVTDVFVNGTVVSSTSGTAIDFPIPAGVKEFKVSLANVGVNANSAVMVQLGDSGGLTTSGYRGAQSYIAQNATADATNLSTGFETWDADSNSTYSGHFIGTLLDPATNTWVVTACIGNEDVSQVIQLNTAGDVDLNSELTTVRLTTFGGTATFDSGKVNVQYDNQELDLGSGVISGGVVQTVNTKDGLLATGTTAMPADNTVPQITEGDEYLSASITPTSVANKLRVDVVVNISISTLNRITAALFQDSTASALAAAGVYGSTAVGENQITFTHWMDAGTTSSTTFSVRAGNNGAGTTTFNGRSGSQRYGGVNASSITITEYKA